VKGEASRLSQVKNDVEQEKTHYTKRTRRSRTRWIGGAVLVFFALATVALIFTIYHAEAILRGRIIDTLCAQFHSRVELPAFHVSVAHGLQVSGRELKIFGKSDLNTHQPGIQPLITVDEFRFGASILNLLRTPMRVHRVYLKGLELNIPPREQKDEGFNLKRKKVKIYVDEFVCEQARLVINTLKPDKLPLEFDIGNLDMKEIGPGQPLRFTATLINPKPVGDIQSSGLFGPWQADDPRSTPVRGKYSFSNADLSTLKGIGGILSSTGEYDGTLGNIVVDGKTETPDFRIAISGHAVPLSTEFHAIVDGTNGDTYLEPVKATILHSSLLAQGSVLRVKDPKGHRIVLDVTVDNARIEDLLKLGVRTDPPVMTGAAALKIKLDLPPGDADVSNRLGLAGTFHISGAHFTNEKVQSKVDAFSMRGQGKPEEAKQDIPDVRSEMAGAFRLKNRLLSFSRLHFQIPGTNVDMTGKYSLDGNQFDFHGKARMDAKLSQMMTGWKSILLKPVDPFFSKRGAGTEVPVKVTGTRSEPHFGLDFGHKDEAKASR
jgi:AsmA-like C-terminal region